MEIPKELSLTVYVIVGICLVIFILLIFGRIDDVIKTNGCVRTKENVSSVQNVISGKITELNYKPGRKVEQGDILYKLDSSAYDAQKKILLHEYEALKEKIGDINQLIESYKANKNLCNVDDKIPFTQFESYLRNKEVLEIKVSIAEKEYNYEKSKPEIIYNPYDVNMKLQDYNLAIANLDYFCADFIAKLNIELNELIASAFEKEQSITKLDYDYFFLDVKAPMDGYVQEIASLNVGDYIEGNSKVLNIVPNDNINYRVEIRIPSKDMGKITTGQRVKYRLAAFPFFEYKGAEGVITSIDPDIRTSEDGKGSYYSVYADIDRTVFSNRHGEEFPIRAGLETNVRIVLSKKTIIYFILKKLDFLN